MRRVPRWITPSSASTTAASRTPAATKWVGKFSSVASTAVTVPSASRTKAAIALLRELRPRADDGSYTCKQTRGAGDRCRRSRRVFGDRDYRVRASLSTQLLVVGAPPRAGRNFVMSLTVNADLWRAARARLLSAQPRR